VLLPTLRPTAADDEHKDKGEASEGGPLAWQEKEKADILSMTSVVAATDIRPFPAIENAMAAIPSNANVFVVGSLYLVSGLFRCLRRDIPWK